MGVRVFTPEMAEQEALDIAMTKLGGAPHWSFEAAIIGAGEHYLEAKVDGIINVKLVPTYARLLKSLWRARFWQGGGGRCDLWDGAATG